MAKASSEFNQMDLLKFVHPFKEHVGFTLLGLVVLSCVWTRYSTSLRHIPGPFSASFSNWWKLKAVWRKDMPMMNVKAHEKYGPLVRIGPNHVSVSDPEAMRSIYGTTNIYRKVNSNEHLPAFALLTVSSPRSSPLLRLCTTENHCRTSSPPRIMIIMQR